MAISKKAGLQFTAAVNTIVSNTQAFIDQSGIIAAGIVPAALEMMDQRTMQAVEPYVNAGYPPDAGAALLIEVDGLQEEAQAESEAVQAVCRGHAGACVAGRDRASSP